MNVKRVFGGVLLLIVVPILLNAEQGWDEVRFEDEIITIRDQEVMKDGGRVVLRSGETLNVIIPNKIGAAGEKVKSDLQRYLPLSCNDCKVRFYSEAEKGAVRGENVLVLATTQSADLIKWAGFSDHAYNVKLGDQSCYISPWKLRANNTSLNAMVIVGKTIRGLLNGMYLFLGRSSLEMHWFQPRYYDSGNLPIETVLSRSDKVVWHDGDLLWHPAIKDNICYDGRFSKQSILWASRNGMNIYVAHGPRLGNSSKIDYKDLVDYAHIFGIKVLFIDMTHRLPPGAPKILSSSEEAIKMSTDMYASYFTKYGIDGLAWHTATESITLIKDEKYKEKSEIEWETIYLNSYEEAIRKIKKDAMLVMLMGWSYMNPAYEIRKRISKEIISWIVPMTPIIDAADADIGDYNKYFDRIWYWIYADTGEEYPVPQTDYLERYIPDALKYGNGIAGEGVAGQAACNNSYLTEVARNGNVNWKRFLDDFGRWYYGDTRMGDVLRDYQEALRLHRTWFNNILLRNGQVKLSSYEAIKLSKIFWTVSDCAKEAKTPLLKDRMKSIAVTAIKCLIRGKTYASELMIPEDEIRQMIGEAKIVFSDHYFGVENDFFYQELMKMDSE